MNCVYCQSEQVVKNGSKTLKSNQVLQRYLCKTCGRRFNDRSGTPMARLSTPAATVEMALNARHEGLASEPPPELSVNHPAPSRIGKSAYPLICRPGPPVLLREEE